MLLLHGSVLMGHGKLYLIWIREFLYRRNMAKGDNEFENTKN